MALYTGSSSMVTSLTIIFRIGSHYNTSDWSLIAFYCTGTTCVVSIIIIAAILSLVIIERFRRHIQHTSINTPQQEDTGVMDPERSLRTDVHGSTITTQLCMESNTAYISTSFIPLSANESYSTITHQFPISDYTNDPQEHVYCSIGEA